MAIRVVKRKKPPSFSFGLLAGGTFLVVVYHLADRIPFWALAVAVVGSLVIDRLTGAHPEEGVYIQKE